MKYHSTQNARIVLNHAMDIVGGACIIKGEKNLLANLYIGVPISITVEGANILTRNLMQFGQGLIRCHPYLYKEFEALEKNDLNSFDKYFFSHTELIVTNAVKALGMFLTRGYIAKNYNSSNIGRFEQKLIWSASIFSLLSEVTLALFGGNIKRKENLSAKFADVLSWLYLGSATLREFHHNKTKENLLFCKLTCKLALSNIQKDFEEIMLNLLENKFAKVITFPFYMALRLNPIATPFNHKESRELVDLLANNDNVLNTLCNPIYIPKDKNEPLHVILSAARLMKETKPLRDKIKIALKDKVLEEKEYTYLLEDALKLGIIEQKDIELLLTCNQTRLDAVSVDSFDNKSYKKAR